MLTYNLEWQMRRRLAPLLFEEDDREGARRRRDHHSASPHHTSHEVGVDDLRLPKDLAGIL